jgi:hypothetical protein
LPERDVKKTKYISLSLFFSFFSLSLSLSKIALYIYEIKQIHILLQDLIFDVIAFIEVFYFPYKICKVCCIGDSLNLHSLVQQKKCS